MILITTHDNPNFDSVAGAFAVSLMAHGDAVVVLPRNIDRQIRKFLGSHFPESAWRYPDDNGLAGVTDLILVCAKSRKRIPHLAELLDRKNVYVSVYDKSPSIECQIEADSVVEFECGSVTAVACKKLFEMGIAVPSNYATLFALGIHEVTGSLLYPNTRSDDAECLSRLVSSGIDLNSISVFLKDKLSEIQNETLSRFAGSRETAVINGVEVTFYSVERDRFIYKLDNIIQRIVDEESFSLIFFIAKMGSHVYVAARNNLEDIDAGEVMKQFGGGGPRYAGSAGIDGETVAGIKKRLARILKKTIPPRLVASDIMTRPLLSIPPDTMASDAVKIMFRYGVSGAPVQKNGRIIGFLRKSDAERAAHHGLGGSKAGSLMCRDVSYAQPGESFEIVKRRILESESRNIIVGTDAKPLGIITRADVMNYAFDRKAHFKKKKARSFLTAEQASKLKCIRNAPDVRIGLEDFFSRHIMRFLRSVSKKAAELGVSAYIVGGIVRDIILGKPSLDIDIAIEGMSGIDFVEKLIGNKEFVTNRHERFKTATVKMPDLPKIDFATARSEFYESPAALPDVFLSNLYQDLLRRDFTINALAVSLNRDNFGFLIDYYGGFADIKKKRVRILHNLSFVEDPTRIFRAIRFKTRLGFKLERHTEEKLREALGYGVVKKIEPIRIFNELELIFDEKDPVLALREIEKYSLSEFICADMVITDRIDRAFRNAVPVTRKLAAKCRDFEKIDRTALFFSLLLLGAPPEKVPGVLAGMHATKATRENICAITVKMLETETAFQKSEKLSDTDLFMIFRGASFEFLAAFAALDGSKKAFSAVVRYASRVSKVAITITGETLKKLGIRPGPLYRTILDRVLEEKIAGNAPAHVDELRIAKKLASEMSS